MTGRLSYIPNIEPTDRCVHTTGLVRLRLKGGMEDESVHYNAGIWTNDNSNKTAVTVIVQGTDEELENPTIVYLSSAWLVFNKAGRPVSIYTIPARCKPLAIKPSSVDTKGKEEDHEDLGRLWCSFMGIPRSFEAVRNDLNIATGTWTVEICVAGKPFSVIVKYGPVATSEIQDAINEHAMGNCIEFYAQWNGPDTIDANPKTQKSTFLMDSQTTNRLADLATLASQIAKDATKSDAGEGSSSKAKAATTRTSGKAPEKEKRVVVKQESAKGKRKVDAVAPNSDDDSKQETSNAKPGAAKRIKAPPARKTGGRGAGAGSTSAAAAKVKKEVATP